MTYSRIVGTGRYLPERIMTNFELEKIVDTSDEWIRTRTGVERRHVVADDQTTSDMCVEAAKIAIEDAGVDVSEIDLVITGTTSPDLIFPNVSTLIQHRLGPLGASPGRGALLARAPAVPGCAELLRSVPPHSRQPDRPERRRRVLLL